MEKIINYALITGASQGLGKSYTLELARYGLPLLLVSQRNEGLDELASNIRRNFKVSCDYFEADLTDSEERVTFINWAKKYPVNVLINNVGMGGTVSFREASYNYMDTVIELNIKTLTQITHELVPILMDSGGSSYILNVSSMAAFCPMGYKSVYPATKKFIQHFSTGLRYELADTNIFVATVFPGPMKTNVNVTRRIEKQGYLAKLSLQSPDQVARQSLKQLFQFRSFIITGFSNKLNWLLLQIIPTGIIVPLLSNTLKKELPKSNVNPSLA
jgi:short-subunit dehydrogenase